MDNGIKALQVFGANVPHILVERRNFKGLVAIGAIAIEIGIQASYIESFLKQHRHHDCANKTFVTCD